MIDEKNSDWSVSAGPVTVCGTHMVERSRRSEGERWCFRCRVRHEFWWVVMSPDGFSYYGPIAQMKGVQGGCTDLFPGWSREYDEEN